MRTTTNRVLVTNLDGNRWKDRITTKGGLELFLAPTSLSATYDIKYVGVVVAVPAALKGYRKNDTEVRLSPGDKVYFNYKTMMRDPLMREKLSDLFGEMEEKDDAIVPVWECDYSDIFCYVKGGEIYPIGDWVLIEKIEHTEKLGAGILINPFVKVKESYGIVRHLPAGVDLLTSDGSIAVGDTVIFKHDEGAFENEIEGEALWCCPADIIFAKV